MGHCMEAGPPTWFTTKEGCKEKVVDDDGESLCEVVKRVMVASYQIIPNRDAIVSMCQHSLQIQ